MSRAKKELTKLSKTLLLAYAGVSALGTFLMSPYEYRRRSMRGDLFKSRQNYDNFLNYLIRRGYIKFVNKENEKFLKITQKGELTTLLARSRVQKSERWDGKWRLIIFDIPEESRVSRNYFRRLLKDYGYKQLQASVFISPHPLNNDAVIFLKQSGLIGFIRFLKVDEIDDDSILRKSFNLGKLAKN
jgi:DNA-binding transcriptional regulator PaaX